jgi:hypothetical protein
MSWRLRARAGALSEVTTAWTSSASLTGGALPERARLVYTDARAFSILGTPPIAGRVPTVADEAAGAPPVVVLSQSLWAQQFASDPAILGTSLRIDGAWLHRDRRDAGVVSLPGAVLVGR